MVARHTMLLISFVVSLLGLLRGFFLPGTEDLAIFRKEMEARVDAEVSRMIELFAAQDREMAAVQRRREGLLKELESFNEIYRGYAQELAYLEEVANDVAGNVQVFAEVARAQEELGELQNRAIFLSRQKTEQRGATDKKCIPSALVVEETERALRKLVADGTGMADFANMAVGGTVLQSRRLTSRTFTPKAWWISSNLVHWLGFDNGIGPVESVISSISGPGRCWAMEGSKGQVSIQLAREIGITSISIEHSLRSSTAPRDFEVYGLRGHEAPVKLLEGSYDLDGPSIQTFPTETTTDRFSIVQFRFVNNWGNEETTCIYRLRVHGK